MHALNKTILAIGLHILRDAGYEVHRLHLSQGGRDGDKRHLLYELKNPALGPSIQRSRIRTSRKAKIVAKATGTAVSDRLVMENDSFNIDCVIMLIMQRDQVEAYLVPKARAFVDWKEYHAHRAAHNSDLNSDLRMMFFDDKEGPGHGFAVRYAKFRIGSAPLGGGVPMIRRLTRPSPIAGPSNDRPFHRSPIQIVITQPDQRGYAGTPTDIVEQMHRDAIFAHESEPTPELWMAGCLTRLGRNAPTPTAEMFLGVLLAMGNIEIYSPGSKLRPPPEPEFDDEEK